MRNRILSMTREAIPYIRQLRALAKSVTGCIVMQQLDYWFARHPEGFYKFLEPCESRLYKAGKSWCEEIGCSAEEFTAAFEHIGVRHKSKAQYEAAADKFGGKYYCSYFDRSKGLTYYFRNHEVVDARLDELLARETDTPGLRETDTPGLRETDTPGLRETDTPGLRETGKAVPRKPTIPVSVNRRSRFLETDNVGLHNKASEITEEITRDHSHTTAAAAALAPGGVRAVESLFTEPTGERALSPVTGVPDETGGNGGAQSRPLSPVTDPAGSPKPTQRNGNAPSCGCGTPHRSRFCDEDRIRIAENISTIRNAESYAMASEVRRGRDDALLLRRLREIERPEAANHSEVDASACPDCNGIGFTYPAGPAGGAKKCTHPRLAGQIAAGVEA